MSTDRGEDLGHGVYVAQGSHGELEIISPRLDLGWQISRGQAPGSAVLWRGSPYEVIAITPIGFGGGRWTLRRWHENAAMRGIFTLDSETISEIGRCAEAEKKAERTRIRTVLMLPLLGAAPARLQKKWAHDWNFAAERATQISAVASILVGTLGLMQALALAAGSDWFLPFWLRWAVVVGPYLSCEGMLRLALVAADGEPLGSVLGLPLLLFAPPKQPERESSVPRIRVYDETDGVLELESPIYRSDWGGDGLLTYRGQSFRLERTGHEGRNWVYAFVRAKDRGSGERALSLRPPVRRAFVAPHQRSAPPSVIQTTFVTACVTLGPGKDQELWGRHLKVSPVWFTFLGAVGELVGGLINFGADRASGSLLLILFDVYLVGEGLLRFGSAATGRPLGSIFGLVLRPLYRRWLPSPSPQAPRSPSP